MEEQAPEQTPPQGAEHPVIETRDLHKQLGQQEVLRGVDLRIYRGETIALIGRSGCGKSVLLKHMVGLLKPTSGDVLIDGESILNLNERQLAPVRKKVSYLFQSGALFDSMTVAQNIAFPLREAGIKRDKELRTRIAEALEVVELDGQEDKMPADLSGGMRKRVALARAVVTNPACILYDEPTTGLDPVVSDSINHLIRRLQKRLGVTSVVVTHDMKSVFHVADRVAYLLEGKIYFQGSVEELKQSRDRQIVNFIEGISEESDTKP
jgi:phospholipid/cholesterol/gamma-HCH transport system ATP-binding protein